LENDNILKKRADIIVRWVNVDVFIASIISQIKYGNVNLTCFNELYKKGWTSQNRIDELRTLLRRKKESDKGCLFLIEKMKEIRNDFTHFTYFILPEYKNKIYVNLQDISKSIDIDKKYEEFIENEKKITPILFDLYKNKFKGILAKEI
jgi:hypothetical protein